MALPIISFGVDEVTKPHLGEVVPGKVTASVEIDLSKFQGEIRGEWENLRDHDGKHPVVYLLPIIPCKV
jgi:intron-binding protein aquarius